MHLEWRNKAPRLDYHCRLPDARDQRERRVRGLVAPARSIRGAFVSVVCFRTPTFYKDPGSAAALSSSILPACGLAIDEPRGKNAWPSLDNS